MKIINRVPPELLDAVNDFSKRLEWARRLPIYEIHKWWARRLSGIVRLFLLFTYMDYGTLNKIDDYSSFVEKLYFNPPKVQNKRLLDPFCGGGTIIIEASNLGYKAHGIEINKLAYLILKILKILPSLDLKYMKRKIIEVFDTVSNIWVTRCSKGHRAIIIHTFLAWKDETGNIQIRINKIKEGKEKIYYCEKCNTLFTSDLELENCKQCGNIFNKPYRKIKYSSLWPFAIEYFCPCCNERSFKLMDTFDYKSFQLQVLNNRLFPIPRLNETMRLIKAGFTDFGELLTPRQLFTFNKFLDSFQEEPYKSIAKLLVSDSLRCCSLLAYYSNRYTKVIPSFVIKSYWLPAQPVELNPLSFYLKHEQIFPLGRGNIISGLRKLERAQKFIQIERLKMDFKVYCGPAQEIIEKLKGKYDIVFTDPPYGNYQFYSDLSLLSLSVLRELDSQYVQSLLEKEITLRSSSDLDRYKNSFMRVFSALLRRLSNEGMILLTFHHHNLDLIFTILSIFKELGLNLYAIYPVMGESSGNLVKRKIYLDLLFVFGFKRERTYFTYTKHVFTKYDALLQDSIIKIIDFYES
ncbi:MAG: hypothetical protein QXS69_02385 [Candidatus Aenigmatarchaeota archaeon]